MTKKNNLLLISLLITISLFVYLTVHHFAVKLGISGDALCSISKTVNCDAAALSTYSEFFTVPIALLGGFFHLFLLGFVVFYRLGWIDETIYLKTTVRAMLMTAAAFSLIMAFISFFLVKVICPFCFGTYLFSFLNLYLGWNIIQPNPKENLKVANYFQDFKSHLIALALIPVTSWIVSGMIQEKYGLSELNKIIPEKISQWVSGTTYTFDPQIGLRNEVTSDKIVLVEFADFKCPHCKVASKTIETFLQNRSDVQFIFKPFPLDGNCNASEQMQKGDGSRCTLAAWVLCAEKLAQKGWPMHHWVFENQEELGPKSDLTSYVPEVEKMFSLNHEAFSACVDSTETYDQIKKSAAEGNVAQVSGTPTIYLNGKKLGYGHIMQVLQSAVNSVR